MNRKDAGLVASRPARNAVKAFAAILLGMIIAMLVSAIVAATPAYAATEDEGGCSYKLDETTGTLSIFPTDGVSGTLLGRRHDAAHPSQFEIAWPNTVKKVVVEKGIKASSSIQGLFAEMPNCISIDLSNLDTTGVNDLWSLFENSSKLESINLSGLNTSSVVYFHDIFAGCTSLKSLDLSSFTVTCEDSLWTIDSGLCRGMFADCTSLQTVKVGAGFKFVPIDYRDPNPSRYYNQLPDGNWRSAATGKVYTPLQIAKERSNIADTYTRTTDAPTTGGSTTSGKPKITSGANTMWKAGASTGCAIRSSADLADFKSVKVDGSVVAASNYDLKSGSTIVTLKPAYLETLASGRHDIAIESTSGTATTTFYVVKSTDIQPMYRLYNRVTSEHLYTSSAYERDQLTKGDWDYEGVGWSAPKFGAPVYRLYNPGLGDHHYTTSKTERDQLIAKHGWQDEGIGWYSGGDIPLYRQYNSGLKTGQHNYTKNIGEQSILVSQHGWKAEGIAWYGV